MHEPRPVRKRALEQVLSDPWVTEQRDAGGQIMVCGLTGRILHADDGIAALADRPRLPNNAFDMIAPGHAVQASTLVARHLGRPLVTRFPWSGPDGALHWCRFEVRWPKGLVLMAVFPERDPSRHHVHAERAR